MINVIFNNPSVHNPPREHPVRDWDFSGRQPISQLFEGDEDQAMLSGIVTRSDNSSLEKWPC